MFNNFDYGYGQASRDYEEWLYNPERGTKTFEDYEREAEEKELESQIKVLFTA